MIKKLFKEIKFPLGDSLSRRHRATLAFVCRLKKIFQVKLRSVFTLP